MELTFSKRDKRATKSKSSTYANSNYSDSFSHNWFVQDSKFSYMINLVILQLKKDSYKNHILLKNVIFKRWGLHLSYDC